MASYAAINTPIRNGAELLLSKPRGIAHGGGQRLSMTTESEDYLNMVEMLNGSLTPHPAMVKKRMAQVLQKWT